MRWTGNPGIVSFSRPNKIIPTFRDFLPSSWNALPTDHHMAGSSLTFPPELIYHFHKLYCLIVPNPFLICLDQFLSVTSPSLIFFILLITILTYVYVLMCSVCISLFPIVTTQSCLTLCNPISWLQHANLPCPSPSPRDCSNSCPLSQWCHPTISSSVGTKQVQNKYFWNKLMCSSKSTIDRISKVTDVSKGVRGFAYFPLMTKFSVFWNVIELRSWKEPKVQRKWDS